MVWLAWLSADFQANSLLGDTVANFVPEILDLVSTKDFVIWLSIRYCSVSRLVSTNKSSKFLYLEHFSICSLKKLLTFSLFGNKIEKNPIKTNKERVLKSFGDGCCIFGVFYA